ncbi:protease-4 [Modicisalibacter ilicicola DSM 19980]|uniref:Protease-4 n=1 Tax=Modicisalibacter ilicicola DSM 19980 TaxID=1121942 RepID=A0A1M5CHM9_9GAMM|nr:signal peptide peptidase SppA [Halomonas ilicicola]SHF54228.1 protease-4 [Halomonas ilicicola DSM 19980]
MSDDDKRYDEWTDGPELSRDEARRRVEEKEVSSVGDEDADVLRERQRLAQLEMMDRWIGGVLAEQRRSRRWKLFFRFLFAVLILGMLATSIYSLFFAGMTPSPIGPHLGVVRVEGVIDSESEASAERVNKGLQRAWENAETHAVVLHINSPGGSPVQSQRIFDEIRRLRQAGDKPILAVIGDIGASGAYYVAAGADDIYAAPASLVGSIGVVYSGFGLQDAIERLGVERRVFTAGENKAFLDPFSDIAPDQRRFWQQVLETTHRQFIDDVKAGRGERLSDDPALFTGLVWTGEQARELGLIDGLKSLDELARERLGEARTRDYTPALDPFERLSRQFGRVAAQWLGLPQAASPVRYELP